MFENLLCVCTGVSIGYYYDTNYTILNCILPSVINFVHAVELLLTNSLKIKTGLSVSIIIPCAGIFLGNKLNRDKSKF